MELLLVLAVFILLAAAAARWGRDTRDGFTESRPAPTIPNRRPGLF